MWRDGEYQPRAGSESEAASRVSQPEVFLRDNRRVSRLNHDSIFTLQVSSEPCCVPDTMTGARMQPWARQQLALPVGSLQSRWGRPARKHGRISSWCGVEWALGFSASLGAQESFLVKVTVE